MKTVSRLSTLVAAVALTAAVLPARAQERAPAGPPNPAPVAAVDTATPAGPAVNESPAPLPVSPVTPLETPAPTSPPPQPTPPQPTSPADGQTGGVADVGSRTATVSPYEQMLLSRRLIGASDSGARDPFATPSLFKRAAADASGDPRFLPLSGQIPKLSLRGYVEPKGKPPMALIEIEGQGTYVVRKGDTIGLSIAGKSSVLKVVNIEQSSARIEAGQLGQVIIVR